MARMCWGTAHSAFRVSEMGQAFEYLEKHELQIIDPRARKRPRNLQALFIRPRTTEPAVFGYLMEIVEAQAYG